MTGARKAARDAALDQAQAAADDQPREISRLELPELLWSIVAVELLAERDLNRGTSPMFLEDLTTTLWAELIRRSVR